MSKKIVCIVMATLLFIFPIFQASAKETAQPKNKISVIDLPQPDEELIETIDKYGKTTLLNEPGLFSMDDMENEESEIYGLPEENIIKDSGVSFYSTKDVYQLKTRNDYTVFDLEGNIDPVNLYSLVGPISLQSGQLCHVELEPLKETNANYDLVLYQIDAQGNLITTPVDYSTLTDKTVANSVGTANLGQTQTSYAVAIMAQDANNISEKYKLHIDLSNTYDDIFEANENPYTATSFGTLESKKIYTVNATISSPYDNDWYDIYVPGPLDSDLYPEFQEVIVRIDPSGINENSEKLIIAMYSPLTNSTLVRQSNGGTHGFTVRPNSHNYIKLFSYDKKSFSKIKYSIQVIPRTSVAKMTHAQLMNGEPIPFQNYSFAGSRMTLLGGSKVEWIAYYTSPNGRIAVGCQETLEMGIYNMEWKEGTPSRASYGTAVESGGIAQIALTAPSTYGKHPGAGMRYDANCEFMADSSYPVYYYEGSPIFSQNQKIYITSRIMT